MAFCSRLAVLKLLLTTLVILCSLDTFSVSSSFHHLHFHWMVDLKGSYRFKREVHNIWCYLFCSISSCYGSRWIMDVLYIVEAILNIKFLGVETTEEVFLTSCFSFSAGCLDGSTQWRTICLNWFSVQWRIICLYWFSSLAGCF